jgi:hypothetical protein
MWESLKWFWHDNVWSKVIAGLILLAITSVWSARSGWFARIRKPSLRKIKAYASDQSDAGASYPLKYYLEVINDSRRCVAVRVFDFKPNAVSLQKFVPDTLQIMLNGKWCPTPDSIDSVALLPHQRCRAWIGVDTKKFTKADLDRLEANIGTLILTANSKKIEFPL